MPPMPQKPIAHVIQEYRTSLLTIPGILGIGQGGSPDTPHITLYVRAQTLANLHSIPAILEGYPVVIQDTSGIEAL
jgi:hypothetical protein